MKTRNNISTKQKLYLLPFMIVLLTFAMQACDTTDSGDEEDERFQDGILVEVRELLGDNLLTTIETEMEMPIHRGENPPDIEAVFSQQKQKTAHSRKGITVVMKPYNLLSTNVPGDVRSPGDMFADRYLRFSNQNMENYTVDLDYIQAGISYSGSETFIIGQEKMFTVVSKEVREFGQKETLAASIFSGIITEKGIIIPHYAFILIDDGGISGLIPEGTGRAFIDGDGTAEITHWPDDRSVKQEAPDMAENLRPDISDLK